MARISERSSEGEREWLAVHTIEGQRGCPETPT
jgi:hypothetical protein